MIACGVHAVGSAGRDTQWEIGRHSEDNNGLLWLAKHQALWMHSKDKCTFQKYLKKKTLLKEEYKK